MAIAGLALFIALVVFAVVVLAKSIALVPQAEAAVIERLGRYSKTVSGQLTLLVPFVDKVRARIDLRERVVSFPPQPVITEDNLTVNIDTVVYFQVTSPQAAVYQISNYIIGVEQLTTTTLRNVVGGMTLEQTLTSRDQINGQLRGVLDEATGRWGLRVARVELRSIDPPPSVQESMEKQMKAEREKRAMILTAEGVRESSIKQAEGQKQAQILAAEGAKQAAILAAEADRQSRMLRAQGERAAMYFQAQGQAKAIEKTFAAIKAGRPTPELLAYQYLQTLPQMARGEANKVWVVPSDFGSALQGFTKLLGAPGEDGVFRYQPSPVDGSPAAVDDSAEVADWFSTGSDPAIAQAVARAEAEARTPVQGSVPPPRPQPPLAAPLAAPRPQVPPAPVPPTAPWPQVPPIPPAQGGGGHRAY
jgi:regulator of protease activity HflC (stomatin/prohibitin superfamily)